MSPETSFKTISAFARKFSGVDSRSLVTIYETALSNTPDFIYVIGTDHRFIYANQSLLSMWGRTPETTVGHTFTELGYEQWHADMHDREIDTVIETRKSIRGEVPFTGTLGRRIYDYIFAPVFDEQGEVIAIAGTTRDVTERKRMEEALLKSEARARNALDASEFVGTWDWNVPNNLVVSDERFARLYSVDPQWAARGAPIAEFVKAIHPEDVARVSPVIEETLMNGGEFSEEYRILKPDGSIIWVIARGRVHQDAEGRALNFSGAVVDITERKLAEQQLRHSEQQLQHLTDALPQQIWTARPDGQLDYVNAYTTGYAGEIPVVDGIVNWTQVVHPDDLPASLELWMQSLATGNFYETEQRILHKDSGEYRWNLTRAVPVLDDKGKITKWFGTNTDIEVQKRAQQVLHEKDVRLRTALQAGRMGTWELNVERAHLICSDTCKLNYGLTPEDELSYETIFSLIHPDDQQYWKSVVTEAVKTLNDFEMEYRIVWPDGSLHWIYVRGSATTVSENKAVMLSGVSIDITERKKLETIALEAQANAEAANLAKSEFLANMSHEIRTPMNAVIGLSTILAKSPGLSPKQKEYVQTLQLSADALLGLINDLLDISKIEARSVELEEVPFSLTQLLSEVTSMMSVRAREKNLTFTAEGLCGTNPMVIGDPMRLRQIILNLCSNAIKFTDKGGVHLKIACMAAHSNGMQDVVIAIRDTGIGIAADKQGDIFQKFTQADSSINRKYGGTGLGLAITKTLTEIMKGTITLESKPGEGSVFTVTVPLKTGVQDTAEALPATDDAAVGNHGTSQHRVLLVEDYAANVMVAGSYLELFGYEYDVAENGAEAVKKAASNRYLAILMDVQMHGMNGFEATKLIRAQEKQDRKMRTPIIGMTAHALMGDRERCIAADMDDYLSKPYNPDMLEEKLSAYAKELAGDI